MAQRRMGPAPFASFEDLSDEVRAKPESPDAGSRLPGISEDPLTSSDHQHRPSQDPPSFLSQIQNFENSHSFDPRFPDHQTCTLSTFRSPTPDPKVDRGSSDKQVVQTHQRPPLAAQSAVTLAPRIDISRASSSSREHDSRDSGTDGSFEDNTDDSNAAGRKRKGRSASVTAAAGSSLGFREEGTLDLRSSTEELDFLGPGAKPVEEPRRESQCSEVVLLCISGRTSRVSSIGSHGSGQSRLARTPSPHSVLLETSFCGPKAPTEGATGATPLHTRSGGQSNGVLGQKVTAAEPLERVLLARGTDPTEAVLAEGFRLPGVQGRCKTSNGAAMSGVVNKQPQPRTGTCPITATAVKTAAGTDATTGGGHRRKSGDDVKGNGHVGTRNGTTKDRTITTAPKPRKLPQQQPQQSQIMLQTLPTSRPSSQQSEDYIRIRLKPVHMYSDEDDSIAIDTAPQSCSKPATLDLRREDEITRHPEQLTAAAASPRNQRRHSPASRTPSPSPASVSRKSSFCSLFKSREAIASPESPAAGRSKSSEKGSVLALFKPRGKSKSKSPVVEHRAHQIKQPMIQHEPQKVPSEPEYIRISLHTPTEEDLKSGFVPKPDLEQVFGRDVKSKNDSDAIRIPLHGPPLPTKQDHKVESSCVMQERKLVSEHKDVRVQRRSPTSDGIRIPLHGPPVKQEDITRVFESCSRQKTDEDNMKLKSDSVRIPMRTTTPEDVTSYEISSKSSGLTSDKSSSKQDYVHISLHTPPQEQPATCFAKMDRKLVKSDKSATSPTPVVKQARSAEPERIVTSENSRVEKAPSPQVGKKQSRCRRIMLPDGNIRIPLRSPSDEEVPPGAEQKVEEPRIEQKLEKELDRTMAHKRESKSVHKTLQKIEHIQDVEVERKQEEEQITTSTQEDNDKKKTRKRIVFTTKLGSREEQVFSTQFSLSKSLSSQPGSPEDEKDQSKTEAKDVKVEQQPYVEPVVEQKIIATSSADKPIQAGTKPAARKFFMSKRSLAQQILDYERDRPKTPGELVDIAKAQASQQPKPSQEEKWVATWKDAEQQNQTEKPSNGARKKEFVKTDSFQKAMLFDQDFVCETSSTKDLPQKHRSPTTPPGMNLLQLESESRNKSPGSEDLSPGRRSDVEAAMRRRVEQERADMLHEAAAAAGAGSSESDSEDECSRRRRALLRRAVAVAPDLAAAEQEIRGLVAQQDESFEFDEFPYVPTTLPQERSVAAPIMPVKQRPRRAARNTCKVERPRPTTPIEPSRLQQLLRTVQQDTVPAQPHEKLRIRLPTQGEGEDGTGRAKQRSPRRPTDQDSSRTWFEFAEQAIAPTRRRSSASSQQNEFSPCQQQHKPQQRPSCSTPPPPLPPRRTPSSAPPVISSSSSAAVISGGGVRAGSAGSCSAAAGNDSPISRSAPVASWINFEEIPEKRKPPKRIQTIPTSAVTIPSHHRTGSSSSVQSPPSQQQPSYHAAAASVTYVDPEDCRCECHEGARTSAAAGGHQHHHHHHTSTSGGGNGAGSGAVPVQDEEDRRPLLLTDAGAVSDSSPELSSAHDPSPLMGQTLGANLPQSGPRLGGPFQMDLDLGTPSNRSSIVSQDGEGTSPISSYYDQHNNKSSNHRTTH